MKKMFISAVAVSLLAAANLFSADNLSAQDYPDFTYAAETAVNGVVYVEVTINQNYPSNQINDPFFRFFFGDEVQP